MTKTNYLLFVGWLVSVVGLSSMVTAQDLGKGCENWRKIPQNVLPFVYLTQNASPVTLGDGQAFFTPEKKLELSVVVRNNSDKKVRAVSLSFWHLGGSGGDRLPLILEKGILPGKEIRVGGPECANVNSLSDQGFKVLGVQSDQIQTLIVVSIRRIVLDDGSVLTDGGLTDRFHQFGGRVNVEEAGK